MRRRTLLHPLRNLPALAIVVNLTKMEKTMLNRNINIRECNNGWVAEVNNYQIRPTNCCGESEEVYGPYVFTDLSEMMEFIEDCFADEEE
jgi:hypothetical protein